MNAKDRVYNRRGREVRRSSPDWRMRSPSDEGRDNTTRPERGPLGSGGGVEAGDRTLGRMFPTVRDAAEGWSKRGSARRYGRVGLNFEVACGRLLTELMGA